ncbi:MAG: hypothetical protein WEB00_06685 [Dehalococcoidia bacterium]
MAVNVSLSDSEARILRLAVFYMLGHPRWQSDRATSGRREELVDVYRQASAGGEAAGVRLAVEPQTVLLLDSALGRVMPELKTYGMLAAASAGKRDASMVAGFDQELASLFPGVTEDQVAFDQLLGQLMGLRRDFGRTARALTESAEIEAAEALEQERQSRPRWQFWRR